MVKWASEARETSVAEVLRLEVYGEWWQTEARWASEAREATEVWDWRCRRVMGADGGRWQGTDGREQFFAVEALTAAA